MILREWYINIASTIFNCETWYFLCETLEKLETLELIFIKTINEIAPSDNVLSCDAL